MRRIGIAVVRKARGAKVRFDMDHDRIKKIVDFIASLLIEADAPALLREKFGYLSPEELKVVTEWLRAMAEQNFAESAPLRHEDQFQPYRRTPLSAASV
jgi:hypothetical protein